MLTPTYTSEPVQDGERTTTVRRVGDIQALLRFLSHSRSATSHDFAAIEVLASILGENVSGRLYKALVDNKKATRVFGEAMQMNEPGVIYFGAILNKTDSLDDARNTMLTTIDSVIKEPPSKEEVDRASTRLLEGYRSRHAQFRPGRALYQRVCSTGRLAHAVSRARLTSGRLRRRTCNAWPPRI